VEYIEVLADIKIVALFDTRHGKLGCHNCRPEIMDGFKDRQL